MPVSSVPAQPGNRLRLEVLHRADAGEAAVEVYYAEMAGELAEKDLQTEGMSTEDRHKILHELLEKAEKNKQEIRQGSDS